MKEKLQSAKNLIGVGIAWVVIYALFCFLKPETFLSPSNFELMIRQSLIVGFGAIGMTYIIITGGIDLSAGSMIALTTVTMGVVLKATQNPVFSLIAGLATGALAGLLNGLVIARFSVGPFIVTLASMLAFRGIAKGLSNEQTVSGLPATWLQKFTGALAPSEKWQLIPLGGWLWLALLVLMALVLRYTVFGRRVIAVGSNEQTAKLCGIRPERIKLMAYTLGGIFAGFAGMMQFSRNTIGDPTAAAGAELQIIAAVVIGGASLSGGEGSLIGAAIGTLIMTTINMGCSQLGISNWIQEILTGLIILLAVGLDRWRLVRAANLSQ